MHSYCAKIAYTQDIKAVPTSDERRWLLMEYLTMLYLILLITVCLIKLSQKR